MIVSPPATDHSARRRINNMMYESLANGGHSEQVAFFCECSDVNCYAAVWLTPAEYEAATSDTAWLALAYGHAAPSTA